MAACSICLEDLNDPEQTIKKLTTCKHAFHTACIDNWILTQGHSRCPDCRVDVSPAQFPGLAVENVADPVLQAHLRQAEELSRALAAGGGGAGAGAGAGANEQNANLQMALNASRALAAGGGGAGAQNANLQMALNASRALAAGGGGAGAQNANLQRGLNASRALAAEVAAQEAKNAANLQRGLNASRVPSMAQILAGGGGGSAQGQVNQRGFAQAGWTCPRCTFFNNEIMPYCEVCRQPKPGGGGSSERKSRRKQRGGSQKMHNVLTKLTNNRKKIKNMKNNTLRLLKIHANSTRRKSSNRSRR